MKKLLLTICLCIFSFFVFPQNTEKYTSVNLNLRSLPNTNGSILAVIPQGTSVSIAEDCDCDWIRVYYNGKIGYVSSKYLTENPKKQIISTSPNGEVKYYTNSKGERVQSPTYYNSRPAGAYHPQALCGSARDGSRPERKVRIRRWSDHRRSRSRRMLRRHRAPFRMRSCAPRHSGRIFG